MDEIVQIFTEVISQDPTVNIASVEKVPFSTENFVMNGWTNDFVVFCLTGEYIGVIYYTIGEIIEQMVSNLSANVKTNITAYTDNDGAHVTVEVMYL